MSFPVNRPDPTGSSQPLIGVWCSKPHGTTLRKALRLWNSCAAFIGIHFTPTFRRKGYSPEDAQDLTQEFFARLLAKRWLGMADSARGRFRSFLLASFNHFLTNEWDRARCLKRGGGQRLLSWDTANAEQLYLREMKTDLNADVLYDRDWALRLLENVRALLREDYAAQGKAARFDIVERFLPGQDSPGSYSQAAAELSIPEGTLKSDVHRLKQRYGELLREQIAQTLAHPDEVNDELRHLITVLGG